MRPLKGQILIPRCGMSGIPADVDQNESFSSSPMNIQSSSKRTINNAPLIVSSANFDGATKLLIISFTRATVRKRRQHKLGGLRRDRL